MDGIISEYGVLSVELVAGAVISFFIYLLLIPGIKEIISEFITLLT